MVTTIHTHNDETPGLAADLAPHTPDDDLTTYVFMDEAGLHLGTLREYAKAWEECSTYGYYLSSEVRTWYAAHPVTVTYIGADDNDYLHYKLTANGETVYAVTDGRA